MMEPVASAREDEEGETPLHLSVAFDRPDMLELLLNYGADFSIKDNNEYDVYNLIYHYNNNKMIQLIEHHILCKEIWNCWYIE